jgi:carboxylesterase
MDAFLPGAEPYFFSGDPAGCLLLHGFGSSPGETRWLGQHLAAQGWTVYGLRTAGHGTDYRALARLRWQDWYASLLDGYHLLRAVCERIFIIGHSTGGMLGLLASSVLPVDGLCVLATPLSFRSALMPYAHRIKYLRPRVDASDHSDLDRIVREEQARRGEPILGRIRYDTWPSHALGELYALSQTVRDNLKRVSLPLCLIYSAADETATFADRQIILDGVQSDSVESHSLERSGHNLPIDIERETVFALVTDFIRQRLAAGLS